MATIRHGSFFEIGIYRCSQDAFQRQYDKDLEAVFETARRQWAEYDAEVPDRVLRQREQHFWETYGSPWHYNQLVGWIRLKFFGQSICGELWGTSVKRFQRKMRRRQIFLIDVAVFRVNCCPEQTSEEILVELREELDSFQKHFHSGRCVLDLECFNAIAPHVNWRQLMELREPQSHGALYSVEK